MAAMIPECHRHLYAFVYPLFWPWLWLQIWRLKCWQRETKREVLISVDRAGNLYIRAISDPLPLPGFYRHTPPSIPLWQRPTLASNMPDLPAGTTYSIRTWKKPATEYFPQPVLVFNTS